MLLLLAFSLINSNFYKYTNMQFVSSNSFVGSLLTSQPKGFRPVFREMWQQLLILLLIISYCVLYAILYHTKDLKQFLLIEMLDIELLHNELFYLKIKYKIICFSNSLNQIFNTAYLNKIIVFFTCVKLFKGQNFLIIKFVRLNHLMLLLKITVTFQIIMNFCC